ncbi:MAG: efflux transporter outer membrane subunit [Planctomycetota bacterium]|nr:efflux transporter outer membrane subunit [Planctomycetota bacterium]
MKRTTILIVLTLAGCKSSPERTKPEIGVEIPAEWQAIETDSSEAISRWWETFGSTSLNVVVEESMKNNRSIRSTVGRLQAAEAEARMAGANSSPVVTGSFDARRQRQNFIGFPFGGTSKQVLSNTTSIRGLSLNVSWELDVWGRLRSAKQAAERDFEAVSADVRGAYLSLAAQTTKVWFAIVESTEQLKLSGDTVESYEGTVKFVRDRVETGVSMEVDLRLTQSNLAQAQARHESLTASHERLVRQLEVLLGRYPAGELTADATLPPLPGDVPVGLPSGLLVRRPDIAAAEDRLSSTELRIEESKAARLPRLSLTANGGSSSEELTDLVSGKFAVWSLAGNLLQPVFDGGRLKAQISLRQGRAKELLENYANTVLLAFSEVETSLAVEGILKREAAKQSVAASEAGAAVRISEDRYQGGVEPMLTLLEAQRRALENKSRLLTVQRQLLDNRIDLHLSLGGGFGDEATEDKTTQTPKRSLKTAESDNQLSQAK